MNMNLSLWEILVPTIDRLSGKPIRARHHRVWDAKILEISGGMTILNPTTGKWISNDDGLFHDRMIPVRIACNDADIDKIIEITLNYYNELAIMAYKISNNVMIAYKDENK